MAYVSVNPYGVVISKPEKSQQIVLNKSEWMAMADLREKITVYMSGRTPDDHDQYWCLPDGGQKDDSDVCTRVTLSPYNGGRYLNIRVYVNEKPTRQGVTLSASNWASLQTGLGFSQEASLGRQIYTKMLRDMVTMRVQAKCEGCQQNWSSQRDHQCLINNQLMRQEFAKLPPVDECAYVVELARLAQEKRHYLERPMECYSLCANMLRNDIEGEILESARYA